MLTEMIMSKQYITTGRKILTGDTVEDENDVPGEIKPVQDVQVVSLEIEEADDFGTDPYNRTGSFCVPDFEDE